MIEFDTEEVWSRRGEPPRASERVEVLMAAAQLHLDRVTTLSNRNWHADVLYWGVLLISGSTLIGYSLKPDSLMSSAIAKDSWAIISGYYASMLVNYLLIDGNKHQSLVTERNRYQLCQDRAFRAVGLGDLQMQEPGALIGEPNLEDITFKKIGRRRILVSPVWGGKLLAALLMVSGIFTVSQVAADYSAESLSQAQARASRVAGLKADQVVANQALDVLLRARETTGAGAPVGSAASTRTSRSEDTGALAAAQVRAKAAAESLAKAEATPFEPSSKRALAAFFDRDTGWPELGTVIWLIGVLIFGALGLNAFKFQKHFWTWRPRRLRANEY